MGDGIKVYKTICVLCLPVKDFISCNIVSFVFFLSLFLLIVKEQLRSKREVITIQGTLTDSKGSYSICLNPVSGNTKEISSLLAVSGSQLT